MTYNESPCIPWPLPYQKDFFKAKYIRIIGHLQHCIPVCTSTWNLAQKICAQCFLEEKTICFGGDEYGLHDMDYCNKKDCCLLFQVEVLCSVTNTMHRCPSHPSISSHKPRGNFSRSVCPQFDKHLHSPTVLLFRFLCAGLRWPRGYLRIPLKQQIHSLSFLYLHNMFDAHYLAM